MAPTRRKANVKYTDKYNCRVKNKNGAIKSAARKANGGRVTAAALPEVHGSWLIIYAQIHLYA